VGVNRTWVQFSVRLLSSVQVATTETIRNLTKNRSVANKLIIQIILIIMHISVWNHITS